MTLNLNMKKYLEVLKIKANVSGMKETANKCFLNLEEKSDSLKTSVRKLEVYGKLQLDKNKS